MSDGKARCENFQIKQIRGMSWRIRIRNKTI